MLILVNIEDSTEKVFEYDWKNDKMLNVCT